MKDSLFNDEKEISKFSFHEQLFSRSYFNNSKISITICITHGKNIEIKIFKNKIKNRKEKRKKESKKKNINWGFWTTTKKCLEKRRKEKEEEKYSHVFLLVFCLFFYDVLLLFWDKFDLFVCRFFLGISEKREKKKIHEKKGEKKNIEENIELKIINPWFNSIKNITYFLLD